MNTAPVTGTPWPSCTITGHSGPTTSGPALRIPLRQRRGLDVGDVRAVLDVVHAARREQRLEVDVLVGLA